MIICSRSITTLSVLHQILSIVIARCSAVKCYHPGGNPLKAGDKVLNDLDFIMADMCAHAIIVLSDSLVLSESDSRPACCNDDVVCVRCVCVH